MLRRKNALETSTDGCRPKIILETEATPGRMRRKII